MHGQLSNGAPWTSVLIPMNPDAHSDVGIHNQGAPTRSSVLWTGARGWPHDAMGSRATEAESRALSRPGREAAARSC
jgi:hypothetical protein